MYRPANLRSSGRQLVVPAAEPSLDVLHASGGWCHPWLWPRPQRSRVCPSYLARWHVVSAQLLFVWLGDS